MHRRKLSSGSLKAAHGAFLIVYLLKMGYLVCKPAVNVVELGFQLLYYDVDVISAQEYKCSHPELSVVPLFVGIAAVAPGPHLKSGNLSHR
jgi:hypothetical protein